MRRAVILIVIVGSVAVAGCIAPIPNRTVEARGVSGRVVDAASGAPIAGATVVDPARPSLSAKTDAAGGFSLSSVHKWHGGYKLGSVASYPVWPFGGAPVVGRRIDVSAPGYSTRHILVVPHDWSAPETSQTVKSKSAGHGKFDAGTIRLSSEGKGR